MIGNLGGKTTGGWHYGFCVATPEGKVFETTIIDLSRIFTSVPSSKLISGYPLESIQLHPENGKYFAEMEEGEINQFWQKNIGAKLFEFIKTIPID